MKVILVYKSGGNATVISAGGFAGNFNYDKKIEIEKINSIFREDILNAGRKISNKKIVESSSLEINKLKEQGINFFEELNGDLKLFQASGHSNNRTVRCLEGNTIQYYSALRKKAIELGIIIISNVTILDLIKDDEKICGAVGYYKNNQILFFCKSAVLATGGISSNYNFSTHRKGIQGNGLAMALKMGASLIDMEFIQFMPTTIAYPEKLAGFIVTDTLRGEGATLLNKDFERFMKRYSSLKGDMETRDKIAKSIYQEIHEGRGTKNNTVYLDARHLDREKIRASFTNYELLMKNGIDPKVNLIEISPAAHYTCGGIKVDENANTGIEGLWAAGEVTGGLHGANRLGSVALTENVVYGKLAGNNAAIYSLENKQYINFKFKNSLHFESDDQEKYIEIIKKLKNIISDKAGIVRDEMNLLEGLEEVENLLITIEKIGKKEKDFTYRPFHIQVQSFAIINYCILKSCELRKESRGTHYRKDYTKEEEDFLKRIIIKQENNKIVHSFEEIDLKDCIC